MAAITENYQLKWHSFAQHLHGYVAQSITSDAFSDVILLTFDGRHLTAHKFVLSACSQYMHDLLRLQAKIAGVDRRLPIVIMLPPDITYKTLKVLLQYMYCGEATVSQDILENVLKGGDLLKVKGLWRPTNEENTSDRRANFKLQPKRVTTSTPTSPSHSPVSITHSVVQSAPPPLALRESVVANQKSNLSVIQSKTNTTKNHIPFMIITQNNCTSSTKDKPSQQTLKPIKIINTTDLNKTVQQKNSGKDDFKLLAIKEEPIEWTETCDNEIQLIEQADFIEDIDLSTIKTEEKASSDNGKSVSKEISVENMYTPLTCELCSETFTLPGDWVKHVQSHTDMMPAKRQKRGEPISDDDSNFPPLQCDMCQEYFSTPALWVQHIQKEHTEQELKETNARGKVVVQKRALRTNSSIPPSLSQQSIVQQTKPNQASNPCSQQQQTTLQSKVCNICNKTFPSNASMMIHARSHTGETPYVCEQCPKAFSVKSNYIRHLRTIHDRHVSPYDVDETDVQETL